MTDRRVVLKLLAAFAVASSLILQEGQGWGYGMSVAVERTPSGAPAGAIGWSGAWYQMAKRFSQEPDGDPPDTGMFNSPVPAPIFVTFEQNVKKLGFALLGTFVGVFTIAIGIGPRTVPDIVFHSLLTMRPKLQMDQMDFRERRVKSGAAFIFQLNLTRRSR